MLSGSGSFVILERLTAVITYVLGVALSAACRCYNSTHVFVIGSCSYLIISIATKRAGSDINAPSGTSSCIICRICVVNVSTINTFAGLIFSLNAVYYYIAIFVYGDSRSNTILAVLAVFSIFAIYTVFTVGANSLVLGLDAVYDPITVSTDLNGRSNTILAIFSISAGLTVGTVFSIFAIHTVFTVGTDCFIFSCLAIDYPITVVIDLDNG